MGEEVTLLFSKESKASLSAWEVTVIEEPIKINVGACSLWHRARTSALQADFAL